MLLIRRMVTVAMLVVALSLPAASPAQAEDICVWVMSKTLVCIND